MQHYYARGGFRFVCRDLRFEGVGLDFPQPKHLIDASVFLSSALLPIIGDTSPQTRSRFLQKWIHRPGGNALAVVDGGEMHGATR